MSTLKHLFERNKTWAAEVKDKDPEFFTRLSKQQEPDFLWIGCSDSRVLANQIMSLPSGEIFVHRNIANLVVVTDINCLSVIQYAVEVLKVKHIVVCGHYGCGGIKAAMGEETDGALYDWIRPIREFILSNAKELEGLERREKLDRLCELNVIEQVTNVCKTAPVQSAWKNGDELSVHGWIYNIENGILKDLGTCDSEHDQLELE